ncbi:11057_t:CDS:2, partial [Entrophospora sp. SA101]
YGKKDRFDPGGIIRKKDFEFCKISKEEWNKEDKDKRPDIVTLNNFFKDLLIINKDYKKWKPYREKNDGDDDDVESCCNSCREINITDYVTTQWDLTIPERVP